MVTVTAEFMLGSMQTAVTFPSSVPMMARNCPAEYNSFWPSRWYKLPWMLVANP